MKYDYGAALEDIESMGKAFKDIFGDGEGAAAVIHALKLADRVTYNLSDKMVEVGADINYNETSEWSSVQIIFKAMIDQACKEIKEGTI